MIEQRTIKYTEFILPPNVLSKRDVFRLINDAERIDNDLTTASVHERVGSTATVESITSEKLADFLAANELSFDDSNQRSEIVKQLRILKDKVPVVHMTFATEIDTDSLASLTQWLRESVHPQAVIAVGLQPALVAGVYVRTTNHVHDFSMRAKLQSSRALLAKEVREAIRG